MSKNIIQTIALFLMLIVLPAGSWYYLKIGFEYQKNARAKLLDYGTLNPKLSFKSELGEPIKMSDFKGELSIFSFVTKDDLNTERAALWEKLYKQFEEEQKVNFVMGKLDVQADFKAFSNLPNGELCQYLGSIEAQKILQRSFQIPLIEKGRNEEGKYGLEALPSLNNFPYYVLADTNLVIRNYYLANDENEIKELVEHVAMILPRTPTPKPKLLREKEK